MLAKWEESIYGFAARQSAISEVHRWRFAVAKPPYELSGMDAEKLVGYALIT